MRFVLFFFTILIISSFQAQEKVEIEKSIKESEAPKKAFEDLNDILEPNYKVKWFYQEDGDKKVYEAKFYYKSKNYSVEFKTDGEIYNVEIGIAIDQFNSKESSKLKKELKTIFDSFKIRKIQIEYLGEAEDLLELIQEQEVDDDLSIHYELEVDAKTGENNRALYELIFDAKFNLLDKREIKLKSTDILDY